VYYVGSKTGRDGIHGAVMASAEFDERSAEKRPAVQVGDPFMEKLLLEACLEVMRSDALVGIQDMGAAGLTCSTCEMGSRGGAGIEIDVALVPQRETGMTPYEIMLSESQERMLLVVRTGREQEVERIFDKWDLHAVRIGEVTTDGLLRVRAHGEVVAEVPNRASPTRRRSTGGRRGARRGCAEVQEIPFAEPWARRRPGSRCSAPARLAGDREQAVGLPAVRPHGADQHARAAGHGHRRRARQGHVPRAGALGRLQRALRLSRPLCAGAQLAVAEAARNVACAGAEPIGATNCLNFGNPERPEIMWQFARAVEGMGAACRALEIPITGGNVSLYNETDGRAVLPTPVLGVIGVIEDAARAMGRVFRGAGDRCSTSSARSAASSGSSAIPRRRIWPTSGSTRCSTGARRAPASPPPTACRSASSKAMGYVADAFDSGRSPGCRVAGHRPRPLLDGRREPAGQRAADRHRLRHGQIALCHNGNLVNAGELRDELVRDGAIFQTNSDTEVVLHLYARSREPGAEQAIVESLAQVRGAFSL
jgi:selenophosphate synthetase-related protein